MSDLEQIKAILLDETSGLGEEIVRDIGNFTVTLVAVVGSASGERTQLGGTGTLVAIGRSHYILTAAHVWHEVLKGSRAFSPALKEGVESRLLIVPKIITTYGPTIPSNWGEWGPDVIFLRIPDIDARTMEAYGKCFYNLTKARPGPPEEDHLEAWIVMGTPEELGTFSATHANVLLTGLLGLDSKSHVLGEFDYRDLPIRKKGPMVPEKFGGVSGGGMWRIYLSRSASDKKIIFSRTLEGTAFYELELCPGEVGIRCHGPGSIRAAAGLIV
jgi:hypothetical protein